MTRIMLEHTDSDGNMRRFVGETKETDTIESSWLIADAIMAMNPSRAAALIAGIVYALVEDGRLHSTSISGSTCEKEEKFLDAACSVVRAWEEFDAQLQKGASK